MKSKGAQRVAMQHRIDMAMLGIEGKAHFDPSQLRDPHTGEWIDDLVSVVPNERLDEGTLGFAPPPPGLPPIQLEDKVRSTRRFEGRDFLGEGTVVDVSPHTITVIWSGGSGAPSDEDRETIKPSKPRKRPDEKG